MKKCFRCQEEKNIEEFYKHPKMADGHLGKCKECTKKDVVESYYDNHAKRIEYERRRRPKVKMRIKIKTPEEIKKQKRVHCIVQRAIKKGILIRKPCEVCGFAKADAHHDDYNKPLNVRWLCRKHHIKHHNPNSKTWKLIEIAS